MRHHRLNACLLVLFVTLLLLSPLAVDRFVSVAYGDSSSVYLFITPPMYIAKTVGEIFDLTVSIAGVENLRSLQFTVTYNTSLLDVAHVVQGSFFPPPPRSYFESEIKESVGSVRVNITLAGSETPRSGDGTLALIGFEVVQGQSCASPLNLQQTLLLDSALAPITHDSVSAVYFWKSMQPDPPEEGRLIDLYTPRGGLGPNQPGGEFRCGEEVRLTALVTYGGWPVQNKLVSFEVRNPLDEVVVLQVVKTDEDGYAEITFRIPTLPSSNGTWTGISVVDIAGGVVWDTITFEVYCLIPVGGYAITIKEYVENPITIYLTLMTVLAAVFIIVKRKTHSP